MNREWKDNYFVEEVWEEVNELVDEVEDVEYLKKQWDNETILEYADDGYASWQVALVIVDEPEEY